MSEAGIRAAAELHVAAHLRDGVLGHVLHGHPTGSFLAAVFDNDLAEAVLRADPEAFAALPPLIRFLRNDVPAACAGSPADAAQWRHLGGFCGVTGLCT